MEEDSRAAAGRPIDPKWRPTASWQNLRLRAELLKRTRACFDERGFLEVETPLLSADTVVDRHLDPIQVVLTDGLSAATPDDSRAVPDPARSGPIRSAPIHRVPASAGSPGHMNAVATNRPAQPHPSERAFWLQTSPELAMKRLMAAGGEALYQITRAFRAGEVGPLHNPEFTIVEWYRSGDTMHEGMQLLSQLAETLLGAGPAEQLSYREAFLRYAEIDPLTSEAAQLAGLAAAVGLAVPPELGDDLDGWRDLLLVELVMPQLGQRRPVMVYDFPESQAALARVRDEDPPVAERFELFYRGIELANGYHELLDAQELRRRAARANAKRAADGKRPLPQDNRLLDAMQHGLPACTGVALGFDRVVMLAAGATSLAEVMTFPIDRA